MSRFRPAGRREVPSLNTSSLPDLIFTLLFFFMIVTNMREVPHQLQFRIPSASEVQQLEKQSLVIYVFANKDGIIQLDHAIVSLNQMAPLIAARKAAISAENRNRIVVSFKIDKETKMGLVNDMKQIVRESGIEMIHFSVESAPTDKLKAF